MKQLGILVALVFTITLGAWAQEYPKNPYADGTYLRACIAWNDSTEYETSIVGGQKWVVYKFKMRILVLGVYEEKEIYVNTFYDSIYKFNLRREFGHDYWWLLKLTDDCIEDFPIYKVYGTF